MISSGDMFRTLSEKEADERAEKDSVGSWGLGWGLHMGKGKRKHPMFPGRDQCYGGIPSSLSPWAVSSQLRSHDQKEPARATGERKVEAEGTSVNRAGYSVTAVTSQEGAVWG